MYDPSVLETGSSGWRFHAKGPDDLCEPIAFAFVTEQMCVEILAERELILNVILPSRRPEQRRPFERYDPQRRAAAFRSLICPFMTEPDEAQAA